MPFKPSPLNGGDTGDLAAHALDFLHLVRQTRVGNREGTAATASGRIASTYQARGLDAIQAIALALTK